MCIMGVVTLSAPAFGQPYIDLQSSDRPFEYGASDKFTFEVQTFSNFRLSLTGGIGKRIEGIECIYPAAHLEMQLYNGGIGSSLLYSRQRRLTADFVASVLITGGVREVGPDGFAERYSPLNFFSDLSATPLQNPYYNSISLGSNYVISTNRDRENQLVGVFNLNAERIVQVTYYNDGTPFGNWIGDGYDRYYTGGGMLSYYGKYTDEVNIAELT